MNQTSYVSNFENRLIQDIDDPYYLLENHKINLENLLERVFRINIQFQLVNYFFKEYETIIKNSKENSELSYQDSTFKDCVHKNIASDKLIDIIEKSYEQYTENLNKIEEQGKNIKCDKMNAIYDSDNLSNLAYEHIVCNFNSLIKIFSGDNPKYKSPKIIEEIKNELVLIIQNSNVCFSFIQLLINLLKGFNNKIALDYYRISSLISENSNFSHIIEDFANFNGDETDLFKLLKLLKKSNIPFIIEKIIVNYNKYFELDYIHLDFDPFTLKSRIIKSGGKYEIKNFERNDYFDFSIISNALLKKYFTRGFKKVLKGDFVFRLSFEKCGNGEGIDHILQSFIQSIINALILGLISKGNEKEDIENSIKQFIRKNFKAEFIFNSNTIYYELQEIEINIFNKTYYFSDLLGFDNDNILFGVTIVHHHERFNKQGDKIVVCNCADIEGGYSQFTTYIGSNHIFDRFLFYSEFENCLVTKYTPCKSESYDMYSRWLNMLRSRKSIKPSPEYWLKKNVTNGLFISIEDMNVFSTYEYLVNHIIPTIGYQEIELNNSEYVTVHSIPSKPGKSLFISFYDKSFHIEPFPEEINDYETKAWLNYYKTMSGNFPATVKRSISFYPIEMNNNIEIDNVINEMLLKCHVKYKGGSFKTITYIQNWQDGSIFPESNNKVIYGDIKLNEIRETKKDFQFLNEFLHLKKNPFFFYNSLHFNSDFFQLYSNIKKGSINFNPNNISENNFNICKKNIFNKKNLSIIIQANSATHSDIDRVLGIIQYIIDFKTMYSTVEIDFFIVALNKKVQTIILNSLSNSSNDYDYFGKRIYVSDKAPILAENDRCVFDDYTQNNIYPNSTFTSRIRYYKSIVDIETINNIIGAMLDNNTSIIELIKACPNPSSDLLSESKLKKEIINNLIIFLNDYSSGIEDAIIFFKATQKIKSYIPNNKKDIYMYYKNFEYFIKKILSYPSYNQEDDLLYNSVIDNNYPMYLILLLIQDEIQDLVNRIRKDGRDHLLTGSIGSALITILNEMKEDWRVRDLLENTSILILSPKTEYYELKLMLNYFPENKKHIQFIRQITENEKLNEKYICSTIIDEKSCNEKVNYIGHVPYEFFINNKETSYTDKFRYILAGEFFHELLLEVLPFLHTAAYNIMFDTNKQSPFDTIIFLKNFDNQSNGKYPYWLNMMHYYLSKSIIWADSNPLFLLPDLQERIDFKSFENSFLINKNKKRLDFKQNNTLLSIILSAGLIDLVDSDYYLLDNSEFIFENKNGIIELKDSHDKNFFDIDNYFQDKSSLNLLYNFNETKIAEEVYLNINVNIPITGIFIKDENIEKNKNLRMFSHCYKKYLSYIELIEGINVSNNNYSIKYLIMKKKNNKNLYEIELVINYKDKMSNLTFDCSYNIYDKIVKTFTNNEKKHLHIDKINQVHIPVLMNSIYLFEFFFKRYDKTSLPFNIHFLFDYIKKQLQMLNKIDQKKYFNQIIAPFKNIQNDNFLKLKIMSIKDDLMLESLCNMIYWEVDSSITETQLEYYKILQNFYSMLWKFNITNFPLEKIIIDNFIRIIKMVMKDCDIEFSSKNKIEVMKFEYEYEDKMAKRSYITGRICYKNQDNSKKINEYYFEKFKKLILSAIRKNDFIALSPCPKLPPIYCRYIYKYLNKDGKYNGGNTVYYKLGKPYQNPEEKLLEAISYIILKELGYTTPQVRLHISGISWKKFGYGGFGIVEFNRCHYNDIVNVRDYVKLNKYDSINSFLLEANKEELLVFFTEKAVKTILIHRSDALLLGLDPNDFSYFKFRTTSKGKKDIVFIFPKGKRLWQLKNNNNKNYYTPTFYRTKYLIYRALVANLSVQKISSFIEQTVNNFKPNELNTININQLYKKISPFMRYGILKGVQASESESGCKLTGKTLNIIGQLFFMTQKVIIEGIKCDGENIDVIIQKFKDKQDL